MSNDPALINLNGISDVAIKLLDMIEDFAGWVVSPKGRAADFEEGLKFYKESLGQDTSLTDQEKAVKISLARTEFRKYVNQAKIVSKAIDSLSRSTDSSHIDDIDADWINTFLSYAENISNEKMQIVWGKLLAAKANGNSDINKKMLQIFSCIEREDIEVFCKLCSMSFVHMNRDGSYYPFIYIKLFPGYYNGLGIRRYHLASLDNLGLIEYDVHGGFVLPKDPPPLIFGNYKITLNSSKRISNGNVRFTQSGRALFSITKVIPQEDFLPFCKNAWSRENIEYSIVDL